MRPVIMRPCAPGSALVLIYEFCIFSPLEGSATHEISMYRIKKSKPEHMTITVTTFVFIYWISIKTTLSTFCNILEGKLVSSFFKQVNAEPTIPKKLLCSHFCCL